MEFHLGMSRQEFLHLVGLVSRKIIQNDMNFLFRPAKRYYLSQEVHELLAGMPRGRLAVNLAAFNVQSCIQR